MNSTNLPRLTFLFLLVVLLLLSCTDGYLSPPLEEGGEERQYFEFEGVAGMGQDLKSLFFAESNNLDWEKRVAMEYNFGVSIVFRSDDLFFESNSGELFGGEVCQAFTCTGSRYRAQEVTFKPDANFWECVAENNCDYGDAVFEFVVSVWEEG